MDTASTAILFLVAKFLRKVTFFGHKLELKSPWELAYMYLFWTGNILTGNLQPNVSTLQVPEMKRAGETY